MSASPTDFNQRSWSILLAGVFVATAVFHTVLVILRPGFITDDFLIFSMVKSGPIRLFAFDPTDQFYLASRPLTFLWFWILDQLMSPHALVMKFIGVALFSTNCVLVAVFVRLLARTFSFKFDPLLAGLGALTYAFHHNNFYATVWIANQNESLMSGAYLLSLIAVLRYVLTGRTWYLVAGIFAFTVSALFKQQSLHFPLLFLLIVFRFPNILDVRKRKTLIIGSVVAGGIAAILAVLGSHVYLFGAEPGSVDLMGALWKKPFSIAGTFLYVCLPAWYMEIYNHFLFHKSHVVVPVMLIALVLFFLLRRSRISSGHILTTVLVYIIISFPRMFANRSDRINTLQVLWCIAMLAVFLMDAQYRKIWRYGTAIVVLGAHIAGTVNGFARYHAWNHELDAEYQQIMAIASENDRLVVVSCTADYSIRYQTGFMRTGRFEVDRTYETLSIRVRFPEDMSALVPRPYLTCRIKGDRLTVESPSSFVSVSVDRREKGFPIIERHAGWENRWDRKVVFQLPKEYVEVHKFCYYDGSMWRMIAKER